MRYAKGLAGAVVLALVVSACASKAPRGPATSAAAVSSAPVLAASAYFLAASSAALFAVKSAELAMQRSGNPDVLRLARMRKQNGEGIAGQLSFAGRRLDMLPSASLAPAYQAKLDALAASPDFDRAYLSMQGAEVDQTLRLHQNYATGGGSPTLRPVAELGAQLLAREDSATK